MPGRFTATPGLDQIVAQMIVPDITRITRAVADGAKEAAPAVNAWTSQGDAVTRPEHAKAHGQEKPANLRFVLDSPLYDQAHYGVGPIQMARKPRDPSLSPGAEINCFPADTRVRAVGVVGSFRAPYCGPMVTVRTASGHGLTATPNHPVLTDRGWIGLGELNIGDHLIRHLDADALHRPGLPDAAEPHVEHAPPLIGEVHRTLAQTGAAHRVHPVAVDFYGDRPAGEVDVVRAAGPLVLGIEPALAEQLGELYLTDAEELLPVLLAVVGAGEPRFQPVDLASPSCVSSSDEGLPILATGAGHADSHCLAPVPHRLSGLAQPTGDYGSGHSEVCGERLDRLAAARPALQLAGVGARDGSVTRHGGKLTGLTEVRPQRWLGYPGSGGQRTHQLSGLMAADEVVDVAVRERWQGHVYTLETQSGWYEASAGFIVRNCRCFLREIPEGIARTIKAHAARAAGTRVTGRVTCDHPLGVPAEFGNATDVGARFMQAGIREGKRAI
jgi:hypothetical protein